MILNILDRKIDAVEDDQVTTMNNPTLTLTVGLWKQFSECRHKIYHHVQNHELILNILVKN